MENSDTERDVILDIARFKRIVNESYTENTATLLANAFSAQATQIVRDIDAQLQQSDPAVPALRSLLHRLRGSAEVIGATHLSHVTRDLLDIQDKNFLSTLKSNTSILQPAVEATKRELIALSNPQ